MDTGEIEIGDVVNYECLTGLGGDLLALVLEFVYQAFKNRFFIC